MQLTDGDYQHFERSAIPRDLVDEARIYRVVSIEGRELMGRNGAGDYSGMMIPFRLPGSADVRLERLRLDHPEIDPGTGKAKMRYVTPRHSRNLAYWPPLATADPLADPTLPVIFTEGEKKCLALYHALRQPWNGANGLRALPVAFTGVWNWRGVIGTKTDPQGQRIPEVGVIPDLDRLAFQDATHLIRRKCLILFDANTATNAGVRAARWGLAQVLTQKGGDVWLIDLPPAPGINGCDDFLYQAGAGALAKLEQLLGSAYPYDWKQELMRSSTTDKPLGCLSNALVALRAAPEWAGALAFNQYALAISSTREVPWGRVESWQDHDTHRLTEWLERRGLFISRQATEGALEVVARDHSYHPVKNYLDELEWDRIARIDDWLTLYLGIDASDLTRAIGARWLISAVARVYQPGVKADHVLILEGSQGEGKSMALQILGGPYYSDDMPELGTKDAAMSAGHAWIIELSELEAMTRADVDKVKAFVSRQVDRFRPPYGRHIVEHPRTSVFAGSVNHVSQYFNDDTGNRRFWPVRCGQLKLNQLRRDRDQLWAEAVERYLAGCPWWLNTPELVAAATGEQEARRQDDDWESIVEPWLVSQFEVTTADVLGLAIKKDRSQWTKGDTIRIGRILNRLGWQVMGRGQTPGRRRVYQKK